MNDLKPVAWVVVDDHGNVTHAELSDGSGCDFPLEKFNFVPAVVIPPTHRVVSVELLEIVWNAGHGYKNAFDQLRAIIDNKEQS